MKVGTKVTPKLNVITKVSYKTAILVVGALFLSVASAILALAYQKDDGKPLYAGVCQLVETRAEAGPNKVYTLNPDHTIRLNNLYKDYFSRNARCDELQFHVDHNTSAYRLEAWLAETMLGWFRDIGKTHFEGQTLSTSRHEWYFVKNGTLHRIYDWPTALAWGLLPGDRLSIPWQLTNRFYNIVKIGEPLNFSTGQYATQIHNLWKKGTENISVLPLSMQNEIIKFKNSDTYQSAFTSRNQLTYKGAYGALLAWGWTKTKVTLAPSSNPPVEEPVDETPLPEEDPTPTVDTDKDNDGYDGITYDGDDCNDNNANINPGEAEICGDSIDQDCSGADQACDYDSDNDGYNSTTNGGNDCNDSNRLINPGATEICGNGTDENCDGVTEICPLEADTQDPSIPTNLSAVASGSQIALTWTAATDNVGVTGYNILRSTTSGSGYSQIATSVTNSYTNTGLTNATYYYVVRAYDAAGNTSANSNQAQGTINSSEPICEATGDADCFYIATNGSDSNDGSITSPFASTNPIINTINPGDYIYFRGGSYGTPAKGQIVDYATWFPDFYSIAYIRRSGIEGSPITFKAYPGETPIFDMYNINPEFDQNQASDPITDPVGSPDIAFSLYHADHIVISGLEMYHGGVLVFGSDYSWIENNHIHDLLSDRDNNGLIILYFTEHAYVRNNNLHDTYQRSISDGEGGWIVNNIESHTDAQHNGCITTLSGDTYEGYGVQSSGPFEFTGNEIHDCPVHLFIKNPQGQLVNENGVNLLIKDNYFYGAGELAEWFEAANVVFENNLFKGIEGILDMGTSEYTGDLEMVNEIAARNVTFRNNVFTSVSRIVQMHGQGFRLANGIYSTALEDKFKFYNNVAIIDGASPAGTLGWSQGGFAFGNSYSGMTDPQHAPSKTLSRIDSANNCYINQQGTNLAFLKHWYNSYETITGYSHSTAQSIYGINGSGDLFPSDTALTTHFTNPDTNDFSIKSGSPCSGISSVGLTEPELFAE
ncbi:MAG: MopE-related protein [Patescibacteria group bacterium]|jgi:hypothetical protein